MTAVAQQALQLRDIHLPAAPGLWPLAPGWWVVGALLALLIAGAAFLALRRHRLRWLERDTLRALAVLDASFRDQQTPERLGRISMLLRRIALAHFPRDRISPLTGRDWLRFLDESGGHGRFADGPGRMLAWVPYQRTLPADLDVDALMALVHEWVRLNLRRAT
jgi:hypothetical protein